MKTPSEHESRAEALFEQAYGHTGIKFTPSEKQMYISGYLMGVLIHLEEQVKELVLA